MTGRDGRGLDRSRAKAVIALAATLVVTALILTSAGGGARADTTSTPDTNTRAVLNPNPTPPQTCNPTPPAKAAAPCATATNGTTPGNSSTFTGVNGGDTLSLHIDSNGAGGTLTGVTRTALCRGSLTDVQLSSQILPSNGDCIPGGGLANGESGNGNHLAGGSNPPSTYLDYTFKIGEGTYTPPAPGTAITCDASNPCTIWIQESVTNSDDGSGFIFKHYNVQYAGAGTTTTTTGGTTTTTVGGTTTTTRGTTTTTTGGTTTTTAGGTTTTTRSTTTTTPPPPGPAHEIRCEVVTQEISTIRAILDANPDLPPAAQRFLTRWLAHLEKRAARMHCTASTTQAAHAQAAHVARTANAHSAGRLPATPTAQAVTPSPRAQAVPMRFGVFFSAFRFRW